VERDHRFDHLKTGEEHRRRLAAKNRHNLVTIALFLLVSWGFVLCSTLLGLLAVRWYDAVGAFAVVLWALLSLVSMTLLSVLAERTAGGFRSLSPRFCSIYDPYFWWHERLWKLNARAPFAGTPFRPLVWRLVGVRMGRRVFDDGCSIVEATLLTAGDDCTLNAGSVLQCHSLEDGTFKSDRTRVGARCTLGPAAFVHYGVTMHDDAVLTADAFLMKGEEVPAGAIWRGNPARSVTSAHRPLVSSGSNQ
jgi:non-ribosomal peptide synthetase-like protein